MKFLSAVLSAFLLASNAIFAYSTETNLWADRRHGYENRIENHAEIEPAEAIPLPEFRPGQKFVFQIEDVHGNPEAQLDIAHTVTGALRERKFGVVALEGAFQPIDLKRFQTYDDQVSNRMVAQHLFEEGRISGPILALLTGGVSPSIIGVDDRVHYTANVEAYKAFCPLRSQANRQLVDLKKELDRSKSRIFSPALFEYDHEVERYWAGEISLRDHARFLSQNCRAVPVAVQSFLSAVQRQSQIKTEAVKSERNLVLGKLLPRLSFRESQELVGAISRSADTAQSAEFYRRLQDLCVKNQIDLNQAPALKNFILAVLSAEGLDAERLFADLRQMEQEGYNRLIQNESERQLVLSARDLFLQTKLISFSLTDGEWAEFKASHATIAGAKADHAWLSAATRFYREAEIRDERMASNLLQAVRAHGDQPAILVTGGFHSTGIRKRLERAGCTVLTYLPQVHEKEQRSPSDYLDGFLQERTAIEKIYAGENVFLAQTPIDASTLEIAASDVPSVGVLEYLVPPAEAAGRYAKLSLTQGRYQVELVGDAVQTTLLEPASQQPLRLEYRKTRRGYQANRNFGRSKTSRILKKVYGSVAALALLLGLPMFGQAQSNVRAITVAWTPSPNTDGTKVYSWVLSGAVTNVLDVGNNSQVTLTGLPAQQDVWIAVTSYITNGLESNLSQPVVVPPNFVAPPVLISAYVYEGVLTLIRISYVATDGQTCRIQTSTNMRDWSNTDSSILVFEGMDPTAASNQHVLKFRQVAKDGLPHYFRLLRISNTPAVKKSDTNPPPLLEAPKIPEPTAPGLDVSPAIGPFFGSPGAGGVLEPVRLGLNKTLSSLGISWQMSRGVYHWASFAIENTLGYTLVGAALVAGISYFGLPSWLLSFPVYNAAVWTTFSLVHTRFFDPQTSRANLVFAVIISAINIHLGFHATPLATLVGSAMVHLAANTVGFFVRPTDEWQDIVEIFNPNDRPQVLRLQIGAAAELPLFKTAFEQLTADGRQTGVLWGNIAQVMTDRLDGTRQLLGWIRNNLTGRVELSLGKVLTLKNNRRATTTINLAAQARQLKAPYVIQAMLAGSPDQALRVLQNLAGQYLPNSNGLIHIEAAAPDEATRLLVQDWIDSTHQSNVKVLIRENGESMAQLQTQALVSKHIDKKFMENARYQILVAPGVHLGADFLSGIPADQLSRFEMYWLFIRATLNMMAVEFKAEDLSDFDRDQQRAATQA